MVLQGPLVLNIKEIDGNLTISSHKMPEDGVNNSKSIKKLFPPDIREKMKDYKINLDKVAKTRTEKSLLK